MSTALQRDRQIRVFISSTFRDMHAERDYLVKFIFPQLRKLSESRGVTWGEVDLRWGVTDEQKAEGKVLPLCLEEIRRCRPYFIGLLGERYGWVPEELPPELVEREDWLRQHRGLSVTELEIIHGVLREAKMHGHAYFYLRDPGYLDRLPTEARRADFECESDAARQELAHLKQRLRAARAEQVCQLRENYRDAQELGQLVLEDFTRLINELYPEDQKLDPLDRDTAEHEAFAASRVGVYIGRQEYFDRLDVHAVGDGPPLVVLGESGSGKSALLANWATRYRGEHPNDPVLMHFIGATSHSSDWAAMLRRIMGELKHRFGITQEIPDKSEALRDAFANWLHMAAAKGRVILLLDALNQLEDRDGAPDLVWLPSLIPANVRLVLSTLSGRPLDDLRKRDWPSLEVKPLKLFERRQLIGDYLAQYSKSLSTERVDRIAAASPAANPLYLRALMEELRLFGVHEQLDQRINNYLGATTVPALYEKILERYEEDYGRDRPGLVRDAMTCLWAARKGLSESELLDLLGSKEQPLPRADWSPLQLAAEHALVNRIGLLGFFHDHLREAVRRRYLLREEDRKSAHLCLADYFATTTHSVRQLDELPWQLASATAWPQLFNLLAAPSFLLDPIIYPPLEFDLRTYWARLEGQGFRMVEAYRTVLDQPSSFHFLIVRNLSRLLEKAGHQTEALSLISYLVDHFVQTGDRRQLASSLCDQANILSSRGDSDEAMALYKRQETIYREVGDESGLLVCLCNQAGMVLSRGDLDGATALYNQAEAIGRTIGDKCGLRACFCGQARILHARGDPDGAMRLFKQAEAICREMGDKEKLANVLCDQAELWRKNAGREDEAQAKVAQALEVYTALGMEHEQDNARWLQRKLSVVFVLKWLFVICFGVFGVAVGVALGMWKAWLWIIGGPFAFLSAFTVVLGILSMVSSKIRIPVRSFEPRMKQIRGGLRKP